MGDLPQLAQEFQLEVEGMIFNDVRSQEAKLNGQYRRLFMLGAVLKCQDLYKTDTRRDDH